jgi:hypothetical protein
MLTGSPQCHSLHITQHSLPACAGIADPLGVQYFGGGEWAQVRPASVTALIELSAADHRHYEEVAEVFARLMARPKFRAAVEQAAEYCRVRAAPLVMHFSSSSSDAYEMASLLSRVSSLPLNWSWTPLN